MTNKTHKITQIGLDKLKEELDMRINVKKDDLKEMIQEMRDRGDLSENDGYTLALEEFESNEHRIGQLRQMIDTAEVVSGNGSSKIAVGSKVLLKIKEKEVEYHIVGQSEADPLENRISEETPIGKALVGKKKGDTINVDLPVGKVEYEIINVS